MRKLLYVSAIAVVVGLVAWPAFFGRVSAQGPGPGVGGSLEVVTNIDAKPSTSRQYPRVYSVKFVCGTIAASAANPQLPADPNAAAVPGTYLTEINIHNPHAPGSSGGGASLMMRAVVANRRGAALGTIGPIVPEDLIPNEAIRIDCAEIFRLLGTSGSASSPYASGYVVIYSDLELDVSAVYTTRT